MEQFTQEYLASLKKEGFLLEKDKKHFVCRIVFAAGIATSEQLSAVSKIAHKYGNGTIVTTVRLNLELPGILPENVEPMKEAMQQAGLFYGGTGAAVRPLVACKGTVCKFGLVDTQGICKKLHDEFFPKKLPHKFKINITGCPNNCAKAQLNDIGFMGAPRNMLRVFLGGKFGRKSLIGEEICRIPADKATEVVKLCLSFFEEYGKPKQRFGDLLIEKKESLEYQNLIQDMKLLEENIHTDKKIMVETNSL